MSRELFLKVTLEIFILASEILNFGGENCDLPSAVVCFLGLTNLLLLVLTSVLVVNLSRFGSCTHSRSFSVWLWWPLSRRVILVVIIFLNDDLCNDVRLLNFLHLIHCSCGWNFLLRLRINFDWRKVQWNCRCRRKSEIVHLYSGSLRCHGSNEFVLVWGEQLVHLGGEVVDAVVVTHYPANRKPQEVRENRFVSVRETVSWWVAFVDLENDVLPRTFRVNLQLKTRVECASKF